MTKLLYSVIESQVNRSSLSRSEYFACILALKPVSKKLLQTFVRLAFNRLFPFTNMQQDSPMLNLMQR